MNDANDFICLATPHGEMRLPTAILQSVCDELRANRRRQCAEKWVLETLGEERFCALALEAMSSQEPIRDAVTRQARQLLESN